MKRRTRIFISIIAVFIVLFTVLTVIGRSADSYTKEQHVKMIKEKVDSDFERVNSLFEEDLVSYEIYPLYDEKEKLAYFLVEYEPYGFEVVALRGYTGLAANCTSAILRRGLHYWSEVYGCPYTEEQGGGFRSWSPHTYASESSTGIVFQLDENGEQFEYRKSPYAITENLNEKKYLIDLHEGSRYACAIKKEGKLINLISGEEIKYSNGEISPWQAGIYFSFIFNEKLRNANSKGKICNH